MNSIAALPDRAPDANTDIAMLKLRPLAKLAFTSCGDGCMRMPPTLKLVQIHGLVKPISSHSTVWAMLWFIVMYPGVAPNRRRTSASKAASSLVARKPTRRSKITFCRNTPLTGTPRHIMSSISINSSMTAEKRPVSNFAKPEVKRHGEQSPK